MNRHQNSGMGQKTGKETEREPFVYSYSAAEQSELRRIREKYRVETSREKKMREIRKLDQRSTSLAAAVSLTVGIVGTLMMGGGMSIAMLMSQSYLAIGIILGLAGIAVLASAYPLYHRVLEKEQGKNREKILRLTDELLDESEKEEQP